MPLFPIYHFSVDHNCVGILIFIPSFIWKYIFFYFFSFFSLPIFCWPVISISPVVLSLFLKRFPPVAGEAFKSPRAALFYRGRGSLYFVYRKSLHLYTLQSLLNIRLEEMRVAWLFRFFSFLMWSLLIITIYFLNYWKKLRPILEKVF